MNRYLQKEAIKEDFSNSYNPPIIDIILQNSWNSVNDLQQQYKLKKKKKNYHPYRIGLKKISE